MCSGPSQRGSIVKSNVTYTIDEGTLNVVDEKAMKTGLPFEEDEMLSITREFIKSEYGRHAPEKLAEDFIFVGPFVGPLNRKEYLDALNGALNPSDGFPDLKGNQYGFCVDPLEEGRVWWISRPTGTFSQPFFGAQPTKEMIQTPPQALGVIITPERTIAKINVGTPMDRTSGNTGGLGGLFAFLWFVKKPLPIPECKPYRKSWQFFLLTVIGNLLSRFRKSPA